MNEIRNSHLKLLKSSWNILEGKNVTENGTVYKNLGLILCCRRFESCIEVYHLNVSVTRGVSIGSL